ncbi:MAG: exodeoxyribonuclease VII small subunit [Phycisphaerales bacterium]
MSKKPSSNEPTETVPFEKALEEIETIIRRIESGEAGLEASLEHYERGVALVKRCRDVLGQVEQRVTDLTAQMAAEAKPPSRSGNTPV